MHKFLALLLVSIFLAFPGTSLAFISTAVAPATGGGFIPCADPTSCAIIIGIQVFLKIFGSKLSCLFGSEKDLFAAGLTSQTVVKESAYDNIAGVKSLTDTTGPFGGQILTKQKCKCGGKLGVKEVMMIGPPRRTMVAVTSSTKIYDSRSFNPGNWVLGRSTSEVVCKIPKALAVEMIGTSR